MCVCMLFSFSFSVLFLCFPSSLARFLWYFLSDSQHPIHRWIDQIPRVSHQDNAELLAGERRWCVYVRVCVSVCVCVCVCVCLGVWMYVCEYVSACGKKNKEWMKMMNEWMNEWMNEKRWCVSVKLSHPRFLRQVLLRTFQHHNIDMACMLLETCGRFLYRSADTHVRCKVGYKHRHTHTLSLSLSHTHTHTYIHTCKNSPTITHSHPHFHIFIRTHTFSSSSFTLPSCIHWANIFYICFLSLAQCINFSASRIIYQLFCLTHSVSTFKIFRTVYQLFCLTHSVSTFKISRTMCQHLSFSISHVSFKKYHLQLLLDVMMKKKAAMHLDERQVWSLWNLACAEFFFFFFWFFFFFI